MFQNYKQIFVCSRSHELLIKDNGQLSIIHEVHLRELRGIIRQYSHICFTIAEGKGWAETLTCSAKMRIVDLIQVNFTLTVSHKHV